MDTNKLSIFGNIQLSILSTHAVIPQKIIRQYYVSLIVPILRIN